MKEILVISEKPKIFQEKKGAITAPLFIISTNLNQILSI
jgi:hypothetical protein